MSTQHTPGPWWTTDHGIRDVGGYIAHTISVQRYEGQDERYAFEFAQRDADKRLIAAAPELLAVLQSYSLPIDMKYPEISRIEFGSEAVERELKRRAAIAKATGQ